MNRKYLLLAVFAVAAVSGCSDSEPEPMTSMPAAAPEMASAPVDACSNEGEVSYVCGLVNVEDILRIGNSPWLVASGMNGDLSGIGNNGTIHLINSQNRQGHVLFPGTNPVLEHDSARFPSCSGPMDAGNFSAHGLALRPKAGNPGIYDLYMTSHGAREAIEVFELDANASQPSVRWTGCVPIPGTSWTNSVTILADGGFYATQFMDNALHGIENVTAGEMTGHVYEWHPGQEVMIVPGTELAGANGILVSDDEQSLFVAAFGGHKVVKYDLSVRPVTSVEVHIDAMPDNLRWTQSGTITTGGGEWYEGCEGTECGGSVIYEIDPVTMAAELIAGPYTFTDLGHASVATQVGNEYWIGSYMGNRVATIPVP